MSIENKAAVGISAEQPKESKAKTFLSNLKKKREFNNNSPKKKIIITAIALAVCLIVYFVFSAFFKGAQSGTNLVNIESVVTRGSIEVKIEGTGSVEPIERYDIMPLVRGTILESVPEEGDEVKEGDVLYVIDHTDMDTNIEKTMNSLTKLQTTEKDLREQIANLTYYATESGVLSGFSLKEGESFSSNGGKIGEVTDTSIVVATVPFNRTQLDKIKIGQTATVNIEKYMQSVQGTVVDKSYVSKATGTGSALYDVTIHIDADNIAGLTENTKITASIVSGGETLISPSVGTTSYQDSKVLMAKSGGTVSEVLVKNGQWVTKGQKLVVFENDDLLTSLDNNLIDQNDIQATLRSQREELEDYTITSPIDGKVITKNYKKGDNLQSTNTSTTVMTVADMSKMVFYISADELDIAKIKIGQSVSVEADALEGVEFDAEVTQIATEGVSNNGVTTYQVEVTINNPEGLMPGMNVTGEIVVDSADNVLMVPVSAVTVRGGRYFVFVKNDSGEFTVSAAPAEDGTNSPESDIQPIEGREMPEGMGERMTRPEGGERGATSGGRPSQTEGASSYGGRPSQTEGGSSDGEQPKQSESAAPTAVPTASAQPAAMGEISDRILRQLEEAKPEGTEIVEITVGLSNDEYIEVTSGLSEGQTVVITSTMSGASTSTTGMMGGMGAMGGMGGGMPSGGGMPDGREMPGGGSGMSGGGTR